MLWFDLDNSPHVPLFRPIILELERRGIPRVVTSRNHAQTVDLLRMWSILHTVIGSHAGRSRIMKVLNLAERSFRLAQAVRQLPLRLAVSHGSRAQVVASWYKRLPALVMLDYEYSEHTIFNSLGTWLLIPAMIPDGRLRAAGFNLKKVIRYNGFKEEIYLADFVPEPSFRAGLGIDERSVLVTIRPPSVSGNYHDKRSEALFRSALRHFSSCAGTYVLITNRTQAELSLFSDIIGTRGNVRVLSKPVDGLQLLWHSDLVISGGGTMNREAALLGVPTYSIFTGRRPYLDELLQEQKKLMFVGSSNELESIVPSRRERTATVSVRNSSIPSEITDLLIDLAKRG